MVFSKPIRRGLTLVELLVVVTVVGILVAILLVGVQHSREAARRTTCISHLRQIGIAIANYEQTYKAFPPGVDDNAFSIHVRLLPFLEGQAVYDQFDLSKFHAFPFNKDVLRHNQSIYKCPDNPGTASAHVRDFTSYIGSAGGGNPAYQNGIFVTLGTYGVIRAANVKDGLSHTVAMSETISYPNSPPGTILTGKGAIFKTTTMYQIPAELDLLIADCLNGAYVANHRSMGEDWAKGSIGVTRLVHVLPPHSPNCQNGSQAYRSLYAPSSFHPGGVNCLFGDGSLRFAVNEVDQDVWIALGTRASGEVIEGF